MLKKLRVLFAVVMGVVITFYFLDFAGLTTGWPNLHGYSLSRPYWRGVSELY